jgi:hypothetical protein
LEEPELEEPELEDSDTEEPGTDESPDNDDETAAEIKDTGSGSGGGSGITDSGYFIPENEPLNLLDVPDWNFGAALVPVEQAGKGIAPGRVGGEGRQVCVS